MRPGATMHVVISESLERAMLALAKDPRSAGRLIPRLRAFLDPEEDLIRVDDHPPARQRPGKRISAWARVPPQANQDAVPASGEAKDGPSLILEAHPTFVEALFWEQSNSTPQRCNLEVSRLKSNLFLALKGIYETQVLSSKTVAVIGLGSGGGKAALELAKSGVGHFHLVDFDRLKPHNISRHVCSIRDIGRLKTRAVRDLILENNPEAPVLCHEFDITQDADRLLEIVRASDMVLGATDNEVSKYLVNEACLELGKPAIYAGAYDRAFAGEVIRILPGETGCYACVRQALVDTVRQITPSTVDYTQDETAVQPEPGLGIDIGFLALMQAKWAILTLLRGTATTLQDLEADMVFWVNNPRPSEGKLFEKPWARYFARLQPLEDCQVCGGTGNRGG